MPPEIKQKAPKEIISPGLNKKSMISKIEYTSCTKDSKEYEMLKDKEAAERKAEEVKM